MKRFRSAGRRQVSAVPAAALAVALFGAAALPAQAEDVYPNIVGTWTGLGLDVRLASGKSGAIFSSETVTQIVTEQRDRRFTGTMHSGSKASEQFEVTFVGVFFDPEHFRWSEPNGFLEGRMIDADTIESCYVRTAPDHQNAACQTLKRQK